MPTALRLVLGVVFLVSGAAKLLDFEATWRFFEAAMTLPRPAARLGVGLLTLMELALGGALLLRLLSDRAGAAVSLVVLVAATVGAGAMAAAGVENCGCFGTLLPVTPAATVAKNLVLLALAALLWRSAARQGGAAAPPPRLSTAD